MMFIFWRTPDPEHFAAPGGRLEGLRFEDYSLPLGLSAVLIMPVDTEAATTGPNPIPRDCHFENNTRVGTYPGGGVAIAVATACAPTIDACAGDPEVDVSYSLTETGVVGVGNISMDPSFVSIWKSLPER